MVNQHQAQGDAPKHQGPAAGSSHCSNPEQQSGQGQLQEQEVVVEPAVVGVLGQVAGQPGYGLHRRDVFEHPAHVRPPQPFETGVVIDIRIREFVVMAVQAHPINRALLAADRATGGEKAFEPMGDLEGPMAQEPVIADGHAQAGGDPIEHHEGSDGLPAPELGKECHHRKPMDGGHEAQGCPIDAFGAWMDRATAAGVAVQGLGPAFAAFPTVDGRGLTGASSGCLRSIDWTGCRGWPDAEGACGGHSGPTPD